MPFHVRVSETDSLVRQRARIRGLGLTETIKQAVRRELILEAETTPLRERIAALRAEVLTRPATGLDADKAFYDELSTDIAAA